MPATIFEVMSQLAARHGAINLGQGFPDTDGPEDIRRVAAEAFVAGPNQYPSSWGAPELRQAVAEANRRSYGLAIDWRTEVLVTSGATEALFDCIGALVAPGDEVVILQPAYDCYLPQVQLAGGVARIVSLEPPDWRLDPAQLAAAFSDRTKVIIVNDPMNPAGKVFSDAERRLIAELVIAHDAFAICDEVYEHIIFDGRRHVPLMALPGMSERTLRIGSAGKSFSLTGWKVGYITAAAATLAPVARVHQYATFATPAALQSAVAYGLGKDESYFTGLAADLQKKRDRLATGLAQLGFAVLPAAGTYFVTADFRPLGFAEDDMAFARRMVEEAGVAAVPLSAFYAGEGPRHFVRFCFSKRDEVLDGALERLGNWLAAAPRLKEAGAGIREAGAGPESSR